MIEVFEDVDPLIEAAAQRFVSTARQATLDRARFTVALSGGHSPEPLFKLLAQPYYRDQTPWEYTYVLWSDERFVPLTDKRSNAGMAQALLLDHVPIPGEHVFPMYVPGAEPPRAAKMYEAALRSLFSEDGPRIDLVFLGCGPEGHTASLFPGSPAINEDKALIMAVNPAQSDIPRLTMTPRLLNRARNVVFIAYGDEKAGAVRDVLQGPRQTTKLPAQAVKPGQGEVFWLLDRKAASLLKTTE
jgi:6-phosphogluconolactonase